MDYHKFSSNYESSTNLFKEVNLNRVGSKIKNLWLTTNQSLHQSSLPSSMLDNNLQKSAVVWPDNGVHGKSGSGFHHFISRGVGSGLGSLPSTVSGTTNCQVSTGPEFVNWVPMMTDHAQGSTSSHTGPLHQENVHYLWNGTIENKMATSNTQHNSLAKSQNNLEEGRSTSSGLDSSPLLHHNLYANRSNASSSPISTSGNQSLLVVPQPVKTSITSYQATTNGTGRKYSCKMCPQVFGSKADMQLHTQLHLREAKPYKCSQCSKAFANSSYLSQHSRIHLGIKPYRCEMCARKFTQLSHLQQHIRTHTGDKPYKCRHDGCNKAFSQLSNLQSHSRCHQADKPYKCNSCYKCFLDEASLLEHIPKHKESKHLKTHICQFCGKSYTQETYLAKHMQKHSDRSDKRTFALSNRSSTNDAHYIWTSKPPTNSMGSGSSNASDIQDLHSHQQQHHHHLHHHHSSSDHQGTNPCLTNVITAQGNRQSARYSRSDLDHQRNSQPSHSISTNANHPRTSEEILYSVVDSKAVSSAFAPIQSATMLTTATVARNAVAAAYFPYETFGFTTAAAAAVATKGTAPSNVAPTMEVKTPSHNTFPNQLIALHQIRNYASMPTSVALAGEHPITLKDKPSQ